MTRVALLVAIVLGACNPVESAGSFGDAVADVGGLCHYTKEVTLFTDQDLEALAEGECIVASSRSDAALFVPGGAECDQVQALGMHCAVMTAEHRFEVWSDDFLPPGELDTFIRAGEECQCH